MEPTVVSVCEELSISDPRFKDIISSGKRFVGSVQENLLCEFCRSSLFAYRKGRMRRIPPSDEQWLQINKTKWIFDVFCANVTEQIKNVIIACLENREHVYTWAKEFFIRYEERSKLSHFEEIVTLIGDWIRSYCASSVEKRSKAPQYAAMCKFFNDNLGEKDLFRYFVTGIKKNSQCVDYENPAKAFIMFLEDYVVSEPLEPPSDIFLGDIRHLKYGKCQPYWHYISFSPKSKRIVHLEKDKENFAYRIRLIGSIKRNQPRCYDGFISRELFAGKVVHMPFCIKWKDSESFDWGSKFIDVYLDKMITRDDIMNASRKCGIPCPSITPDSVEEWLEDIILHFADDLFTEGLYLEERAH